MTNVIYSTEPTDTTIYKVSSATKLVLLDENYNQTDISQKASVASLMGLEQTLSLVMQFLRLHSLICSNTKGSRHKCEPNGLLLYGLPGCGKHSCISAIAEGRGLVCPTENMPLISCEWFKSLTFLELESANLSKIYNSADLKSVNPFISWIQNTLEKRLSEGPPKNLVLLIPYLDNWPQTLIHKFTSSHATEDDFGSDQEVGTSSGSRIFSLLYASLLSTAISPVCVLATSTTSSGLLQHCDLRRLFYRHVLVSLPTGHQRSLILAEQIHLHLKPGISFSPSDTGGIKFSEELLSDNLASQNDCIQLTRVAATLHGYTIGDLQRICRAAFAAALGEILAGTGFHSSKSPRLLPPVGLIIEKLQSEAMHYRPANLSAELTPAAPLHWSDIGGYDEVKAILQTRVQQRLLDAVCPDGDSTKINLLLGLNVPRGILLHGPPGCSKTLFVRALATECNLPLIAVQASRIFGRYVGDSERNMRRIIVHSRACAPAILFIDEIDLLLPSRNSRESGVSEHVLGEVLTAMDGVEGQLGQLLLVAATNRLENLDPALRRAGRFDLVLGVPPPDLEARMAILRLDLSKRPCAAALHSESWLRDFARTHLEAYTGAEVVAVVQTAAELARQTHSADITHRLLCQAQAMVPPTTLKSRQDPLRLESPDTTLPLLFTSAASQTDFRPPKLHTYWLASLIMGLLMSLLMGYIFSLT